VKQLFHNVSKSCYAVGKACTLLAGGMVILIFPLS